MKGNLCITMKEVLFKIYSRIYYSFKIYSFDFEGICLYVVFYVL